MKNCFLFSAFLLLILLPSIAWAVSISGFVSDEETGETLIGATVRVKDEKLGAYTNKNGFYSISGLENSTYEFIVSCVGYETKIEKLSFKKNQDIRKDFKLKISSVETEEISVEAAKDLENREFMVSKVNIPVQQIKKLKIGGESDLFRALQYLPGVLTSSQISSGLFVRGGSPDQNLVLLD